MDRMILANSQRVEIGFLYHDLDMDLGDTNDFVLYIPYTEWDGTIDYGMMVYIPETEYGGIIRSLSGNTKENMVQACGTTWRGMLQQKIICPPEGEDYYTVSGDLNSCIRAVLGDMFGDLFIADQNTAAKTMSNYRFERYCTVLEGLTKMLASVKYKLQIRYIQTPESGNVMLSAVPVVDHSEKVEISQDCQLDFESKVDKGFVTHLICLGAGELRNRTRVDLYVNEDGEIGSEQVFEGPFEIEEVYDYPNAEDEMTLTQDGIKRFRELLKTDSMSVSLSEGAEDIDVDIGDVISGRDYITGTYVTVVVATKVYKITGGASSVEYGLEEKT